MFKGALFDLDGVLINSKAVMEEAWGFVSVHFALDITFESYLVHVGKPFETILTQLNIPECMHLRIKSQYGKVASQLQSKVTTYKHIGYLLRRLHYSNYRIGIVTSKEFWRADTLVEALFLTNDLLVTPEFTKNGKPSPDPLFYAMQRLSLDPVNSFYVGDMRSDMIAANAAGITFFAARWGYGNLENAKIVFDSPLDILEYLAID